MWPSLILSLVITASEPVATCDQTATPRSSAEFAPIAGELFVDAPVNIQGPYGDAVKPLRVGDQLLIQIRYPIVPPMPAEAALASEHGRVELVSTARTSSQVAILERNPRLGGQLGVGYVQILVRARSAGKDLATVRLKRADGSVKTVPFAFEVQ
jgi:hypothetical protein